LRPAYRATRTRIGLTLLLLALAGAGWWRTVHTMRGMDAGPWTGLGAMWWFLGVWIVMMAAMMLPALAPTVALYARMSQKRSAAPLLFAGGYLLTWALAGLAAFGVGKLVTATWGSGASWDHAGRSLAGATVVVAAAYQVSPLKDVCLRKCRSPLGLLLGSWRAGPGGAVVMGAKNGGWCLGCCWGLMAALFALGVMSLEWMALVAVIVTAEKTLPARRLVTYGTAAVLLALGVLLLADPSAIPGLTIPHGQPMGSM
jgi:predicted metal-binding membrane protein